MARIPEDKIEEVRSSINVVHFISQFVNLKKAGQNYKGLCPFHTEKTPSFMVSPQKQIFHCFGCGRGGNVFSFIMDYNKVSFIEAVQQAADFAGIALPQAEERSAEEISYFEQLYNINESACSFFEQELFKAQNKKHLEYFKSRRLSETTIKKFRLGFAPDSYDKLLNHLKKAGFALEEAEKLGLIQKREKGSGHYSKFRYRVIFPFQNLGGKILGFGGRRLEEKQQPKYLNSPENPIYKKGRILYGLHQAVDAIREQGYVILVEGYFDLLRLAEEGKRNVVASSGTALGDEQVKILRRYTRQLYIAYDGDQAGVKAALRSAAIAEKGNLNAFIVPFPEKDDPDTFILEHGLGAFEKLLKQKVLPIDFRINHFLARNSRPGIEEKNAFIEEALADLSELNNHIKAGLYIHQLAERIQINESLLIDQFNRIKRYKSGRIVGQEETEAPLLPLALRSGIHKAEAGLISLLINEKKEIRELVLQEVSLDLFENDDFIRMFDLIVQEIEDKGEFDYERFIASNREDDALNQLLSEILLIEYDDPKKFSKDCLYQLRKWQLQKKSQEIRQLIDKDADSPEAVLHYNQELMIIRRKMDKLERERLTLKFEQTK